MSKFVRKAQAALKWIKAHPVYTALSAVVAVIILYDGVSGGIRAMIADVGSLRKEEPPPAPIYTLELLNVFGNVKTVAPGTPDVPPGVTSVVELGAKFSTSGDPVAVTVGRAEASMEGRTHIDLPQAWPVLTLRRGLSVGGPIAFIPIADENADMAGRIDWVFRYGPKEDQLTNELPVKGAIFLNTINDERQFSWIPDADSAKPQGMDSVRVRKEPD